jgi:hypothetical protein
MRALYWNESRNQKQSDKKQSDKKQSDKKQSGG